MNDFLAGGQPAQAFRAAAQQFHSCQQQDRERHKDRCCGQDSWADLFTKTRKHLPRQCLLLCGANEQHHDDLVKRRDKREQPT